MASPSEAANALAADKRIKELEKQLEVERMQRDIAQAQREEEMVRREAAEAQREEERVRREAAEAQRDQERLQREAMTESLLVKATDFLQTPLPPYGALNPSTSYTQQKLTWKRPTQVVPWNDFETQFGSLMTNLGDAKVPIAGEVTGSERMVPSQETHLYAFVDPILIRTSDVLAQACNDYRALAESTIGTAVERDRGGGICDITFSVNSVLMLVLELKRPSTNIAITNLLAVESATNGETSPTVLYEPDDLYNLHFSDQPRLTVDTGSAKAKNLAWLILQTYNYLLTHGALKYGVATNYDWWVFLKRTVVNQEEVLQVSRFYHRIDARLPLASCLVTTLLDNGRKLPHGQFSTLQLLVDLHEGTQEIVPLDRNDQLPGTGDGDAGRLRMTNGGDGEVDEEAEITTDYFTVGRVVAGFTFTTTMDALGVDNLSVDSESPVVLASSGKSTTLRVQIGGRDLVYRQIDVYKLPKRNSDFPLEVMARVVRQELEAYRILRPVWGILVPEFVYFGHDFAMLWVFVTSYVGVSLSALANQLGGLSQAIKNSARESLIRIHAFGILHGDVVPRNAVYRASDKRVLWVDFEMSSVVPSGENMNDRARLELEIFDDEIAKIPTIETRDDDSTEDKLDSPSSSPTALIAATTTTTKTSSSRPMKKSKVVAHCGCCCVRPAEES